jgi:hypothetical protein
VISLRTALLGKLFLLCRLEVFYHVVSAKLNWS